jgi:hypothetical protein
MSTFKNIEIVVVEHYNKVEDYKTFSVNIERGDEHISIKAPTQQLAYVLAQMISELLVKYTRENICNYERYCED